MLFAIFLTEWRAGYVHKYVAGEVSITPGAVIISGLFPGWISVARIYTVVADTYPESIDQTVCYQV